MKNPTVVAILNFFTIGLGTLLLGKRPLYGLFVFIGASLLRYEEVRQGYVITGAFSWHWLIATVGLTLLGAATAMEGYREATGSGPRA